MDETNSQEFPYLAEAAIHGFWGIIGAAAFGFSGFTNTQGLILEGIFLPREVATAFYWVMCAALSGLFTLTVVFAMQARLHPRRISFSEDSVSLPKSRWSSRNVAIPCATILDIAHVKLRGHVFLYVKHGNVRTIVTSAGFRTAKDYLSFCQLLIERTPSDVFERRKLELLCERCDGQEPKRRA